MGRKDEGILILEPQDDKQDEGPRYVLIQCLYVRRPCLKMESHFPKPINEPKLRGNGLIRGLLGQCPVNMTIANQKQSTFT